MLPSSDPPPVPPASPFDAGSGSLMVEPRQPTPPPVMPSGRMGPRHAVQGRWMWLAPLLVLTAGIAGTAVFGVLTYKKAADDLSAVKGELVAEREQRTAAEDKLEGAKTTAGAAVDALEDVKRELAEERDRTKSAVTKIKTTTKKATALEKKLRELVQKSEGEVEAKGDTLTLNLVDKVLFRSGKSELTRRGKKVIKKVGLALKKAKDKQIFVQGHTDDVPIPKSNKNFSSNWELSAARALSVVHYLEENVKISGKRLGAVAFSKHRPVSKRNKAKNRRIEIVLVPRNIELVGGEE